MKFLCVPCDSPMKLQTVAPPDRGSLSVVYACPECGYEMAMLTNAYETQVVQSLGVRIGPDAARASTTAGRQVSLLGNDPGARRTPSRRADARPVDRRSRSHGSQNIPEFVRPMAKTGIEKFAREKGRRSRREDSRRGPRLLRHVGALPAPLAPSTWPTDFARPYVVSWNLTYRCNLACEHCYLDAGGKPSGRHGELRRSQRARHRGVLQGHRRNRRVRARMRDHPDRRRAAPAARHPRDRPARGGAWTVGRRRHQRREHHGERGAAPEDAGARGLSLSLDALDPDRHDHFPAVRGAWQNTVEGAEILNRTGLPFIVQTTAGSHNLGELEAIADFAHERLAAKVWNLYFLVPTGRGQFVSDITPAQYDDVLASLYRIQGKYHGRMLVNAKCAPHYIKTVLENAAERGQRRRRRSGPTPAAPAAARPGRTTWGSARTATSPRARTSRSSPGRCAARASRTSGRRRSCSPAFASRTSLGGRCGTCEMNGHCGGCRARAFGMTGDVMAEDPLCTHTPGTFAGSPLLTLRRSGSGSRPWRSSESTGAIEYGPNRRRRSPGTMRRRSG